MPAHNNQVFVACAARTMKTQLNENNQVFVVCAARTIENTVERNRPAYAEISGWGLR